MSTFNVLYDGKVVGKVEALNHTAAFIMAMNRVATEEIIHED